jgi:hypothetical protein
LLFAVPRPVCDRLCPVAGFLAAADFVARLDFRPAVERTLLVAFVLVLVLSTPFDFRALFVRVA